MREASTAGSISFRVFLSLLFALPSGLFSAPSFFSLSRGKLRETPGCADFVFVKAQPYQILLFFPLNVHIFTLTIDKNRSKLPIAVLQIMQALQI